MTETEITTWTATDESGAHIELDACTLSDAIDEVHDWCAKGEWPEDPAPLAVTITAPDGEQRSITVDLAQLLSERGLR